MNFLCRLAVSGLTRTNTFRQLPALNQNTIRPVADFELFQIDYINKKAERSETTTFHFSMIES